MVALKRNPVLPSGTGESGPTEPDSISGSTSAPTGPAAAQPSRSPLAVHALQADLAAQFGREHELERQARFAREMGSEFVASVLEAGRRNLVRAPLTSKLFDSWPGDPSEAALAMRFNAALHALARRAQPRALRTLYRKRSGDFDGPVGQALAEQDEFIAEAMRHPTQTNEVARTGALRAALMVVAAERGLPFELLELGSSCGLNLNMAHYAFDLGGVHAGPARSSVRIAPEWRGAPPIAAEVSIVAAKGVDLNPLDPADPATIERLMSYVWAGERDRLRRLRQALRLARRRPPQVTQGDALPWLVTQLGLPQPQGVCRVVFHSMVLQYFRPEARQAVTETIRAAGERATEERPLAWISFEWTPTRSEVRLLLTSWPGGETHHLATCHPYGAWVHWRV